MNTGIFGGAFDPFHTEHRHIIECAAKELSLDKVVVVPSFLPPHKHCRISSFEDRVAMVKAGTEGLSYVVIDEIEKQRGQVNPTSVVLPLLKEKYPSDNFYFVMGGDSAVNFDSWINPEKIAATAILAVADREGSGAMDEVVASLETRYGIKVRKLSYKGKQVSSSHIKASFEVGLRTEDVSEKVAEVIERKGLYREFSSLVTALKNDISEKTFAHSVSTMLYAQNFTGLLKLKYEDVFLAALLHDCDKATTAVCEGVPQPVVHQFKGAEKAKEKYGIEDERILDAIRYHTTGKKEMTTLGKLVFCADMLEPNRKFEGVGKLRSIISEDFEDGFVACVKATYEHLLKQDKPIYYLTKECYLYYNK